MSPADNVGENRRSCFPRMSGDDPIVIDGDKATATFSPHERG